MDFERVFDESYERILKEKRNQEGFFEAFYTRFFASSPRIAELFQNTDMDKQRKMLEKSFYRLVVFYATNYADDYLERIAYQHSKQMLDVKPEYYDIWLECLMTTLQEYDPLYDDNVELAWRLVLSTGITYMKFKYDHY